MARDCGIKLRSYARAGIARYWVVNLIDRQVEVFSQPDSTGKEPSFRVRQIFTSGQLVPLILEEKTLAEIAVEDLLPPSTENA